MSIIANNLLQKSFQQYYTETQHLYQYQNRFGPKNIQDCVERLRGMVDISHTTQDFSITVLLPNYAHKTFITSTSPSD